MRLWSLSPRYLDQQGLCGLWREAIMAKNALEQGEEHGYYNHPQLERFKRLYEIEQINKQVINYYLQIIYEEAVERGYDFDEDAFRLTIPEATIRHSTPVTNGQVSFETKHLLVKLFEREKEKEDYEFYTNLCADCYEGSIPDLHPLFYMINGDKAEWERG